MKFERFLYPLIFASIAKANMSVEISTASSDLEKKEHVINTNLSRVKEIMTSVRRRASLSETCEEETASLWTENETLQLSFPTIPEEEMYNICSHEQDHKNLVCDLQNSELNEKFDLVCKESGGKVMPFDLKVDNDCFSLRRKTDAEEQTFTSFLQLGTCAGQSCRPLNFQELIQNTLNDIMRCDIAIKASQRDAESFPFMITLMMGTTMFLGLMFMLNKFNAAQKSKLSSGDKAFVVRNGFMA